MNVFRIVAITVSLAAIAATTYVSYHGIGRESRDLDRSVRLGSGGGGYSQTGRVK